MRALLGSRFLPPAHEPWLTAARRPRTAPSWHPSDEIRSSHLLCAHAKCWSYCAQVSIIHNVKSKGSNSTPTQQTVRLRVLSTLPPLPCRPFVMPTSMGSPLRVAPPALALVHPRCAMGRLLTGMKQHVLSAFLSEYFRHLPSLFSLSRLPLVLHAELVSVVFASFPSQHTLSPPAFFCSRAAELTQSTLLPRKRCVLSQLPLQSDLRSSLQPICYSETCSSLRERKYLRIRNWLTKTRSSKHKRLAELE